MYYAITTIRGANGIGARTAPDHRGRRRNARVDWNPALNPERNHDAAALSLAGRLGWVGAWHRAGAEGSGYVYVCADDAPAFTVGGPPPAASEHNHTGEEFCPGSCSACASMLPSAT